MNDWFLRQWLENTDTSQAQLGRLTGWDKRKTSFLVNNKQPYGRQDVNEVAGALHIEPFELLMHPEDAYALRRMRDGAIRIAAETRTPWQGIEPEKDDSNRRRRGSK